MAILAQGDIFMKKQNLYPGGNQHIFIMFIHFPLWLLTRMAGDLPRILFKLDYFNWLELMPFKFRPSTRRHYPSTRRL